MFVLLSLSALLCPGSFLSLLKGILFLMHSCLFLAGINSENLCRKS